VTGQSSGEVALELCGGDAKKLGYHQKNSLAKAVSKETGQSSGEVYLELCGGDFKKLGYHQKNSLARAMAEERGFAITTGQALQELNGGAALANADKQKFSLQRGNIHVFDQVKDLLYGKKFVSTSWSDTMPTFHQQGGRHVCLNRNPSTKQLCDHRIIVVKVNLTADTTYSIQTVYQTPRAMRDADNQVWQAFNKARNRDGLQGWTLPKSDHSAVVLVPFIVASALLKVGAIAMHDFVPVSYDDFQYDTYYLFQTCVLRSYSLRGMLMENGTKWRLRRGLYGAVIADRRTRARKPREIARSMSRRCMASGKRWASEC